MLKADLSGVIVIIKMGLSKKQQEFVTLAETGSNIFLTGKAGSGKTFIVKQLMARLNELNKKVIAIAPTGIAANNIGGQTIHSLFSINPHGITSFDTCAFLRGEKRRMLKAINVIFIDEISMLRPDILDGINWTLLKNGCGSLKDKQIIFIGDLKQLPSPINDNTKSVLYQTYDGENFFNAKCYNELNVIDIELDEVLRQSNEEFINNLNIIREGGRSEYFKQFVSIEPKGIILAPHNATVAKYNKDGLDKLDTFPKTFEAIVHGNIKAEDFNLETFLTLKPGCKIMYLVNSTNGSLVNGTLGTYIQKQTEGELLDFIQVKGVDYKIDIVEFTKKEYVLNEQTNTLELTELGKIKQIPIKLAYALSIHKSQGLTFEEVTVDLTRPCFAQGQMYVALSRVTGPEGLRIIIK